MPVSPHLLWVTSRPIKCPKALFEKWYTTEHVPEIVECGAAQRASFYREILDFPGSTRTHTDRQWLAVDQKDQELELLPYLASYQTKDAMMLNNEEYLKLPVTSEMFPWKVHAESGRFYAQNWELVQDYDPDRLGEKSPPKFIVTVECTPSDDSDYHAWYEQEHLDILHKIPGYRRSQRYKLGPAYHGGLTRDSLPNFVAIHEVDDVQGFFQGPEFDAAWSEWTQRVVGSAKVFVVRAWENLHASGY